VAAAGGALGGRRGRRRQQGDVEVWELSGWLGYGPTQKEEQRPEQLGELWEGGGGRGVKYD
jgi:hypothetical protein